MPRIKLTEAAVKRLIVKEGQVDYVDTDAGKGVELSLRIGRQSKVWYMRYRLPDGRRRRLKLGPWVLAAKSAYGEGEFKPEDIEPSDLPVPLTVAEARRLAGRLRGKRDPQAEKLEGRRQAQAERRAGDELTVNELAVEFLMDRIGTPKGERKAAKAKRQQLEATVRETLERRADDYWSKNVPSLPEGVVAERSSWREMARQLRKDVLPSIGGKLAQEVTMEDIEQMLEAAQGRAEEAGRSKKGLVSANRLRSVLAAMYTFAGETKGWREVVTFNPAKAVKRPLKNEKPRQIALKDEDVARLWLAAENLHPTICALFRLRLLTGQRLRQLRLMEGSEIWSETATVEADLAMRLREYGVEVEQVRGEPDKGRFEVPVWHVPGSTMKTGRPHLLPLTPTVRRMVDDLLIDGRAWVFQSPIRRDREKPPKPLGRCGKAFASWKETAGTTGLKGMDLRRTMRSGLSELGVAWEVKELLLGHKLPGLSATYDTSQVEGGKLLALLKWERKVMKGVEKDLASRLGGGASSSAIARGEEVETVLEFPASV